MIVHLVKCEQKFSHEYHLVFKYTGNEHMSNNEIASRLGSSGIVVCFLSGNSYGLLFLNWLGSTRLIVITFSQ